MRVQILIYALLQATICILCAKAGFPLNDAYQLVAVMISILSGGVLASICLQVSARGARDGLFRISFALLGWLALAPMIWAIQSRLDAPFAWMREQAFWGSLVFMFFMQILPYTAVMSIYALPVLLQPLTRKIGDKMERAAVRKWEAARNAETGDKYKKLLLVASPREIASFLVLFGVLTAATIFLYAHTPAGRFLSPMMALTILALVCWLPFRNKINHACELVLKGGHLCIREGSTRVLDLPVKDVECHGLCRFRPKGFGFILRVQGKAISKAFWLTAAPAEVIDGHRGFSFGKLENDVANISEIFSNAGIARREFPRDAFMCILPLLFIIGILAVAASAATWGFLTIFGA
jgi:hypothetical protein